MSSAESSSLLGMVLIYIMALLYFLPAVISYSRKHPQTGAILVLNIFLGWTFLGWVAALIWSATNSK